jgi:vacuolar-type H+-ATPase subunit F/Vma7
MAEIKHLNIAVVGDEDLVNGLRLAGITRYHIIDDGSSADEVRKAVSEELGEPDVGVIIVQEDHAKHIEDLVARAQEKKGLPPVVIEAPSKYGTKYGDVTKYYRSYIKKFIGFDIEI